MLIYWNHPIKRPYNVPQAATHRSYDRFLISNLCNKIKTLIEETFYRHHKIILYEHKRKLNAIVYVFCNHLIDIECINGEKLVSWFHYSTLDWNSQNKKKLNQRARVLCQFKLQGRNHWSTKFSNTYAPYPMKEQNR